MCARVCACISVHTWVCVGSAFLCVHMGVYTLVCPCVPRLHAHMCTCVSLRVCGCVMHPPPKRTSTHLQRVPKAQEAGPENDQDEDRARGPPSPHSRGHGQQLSHRRRAGQTGFSAPSANRAQVHHEPRGMARFQQQARVSP